MDLVNVKNHKKLTLKQVESFCTILKNIVFDKFPASREHQAIVAKHENIVKRLIAKRSTLKKRREILQKGNGLVFTALLPLIASILPLLWSRSK